MTAEERVRRPDNVTLIAIYHFVVGALGLIGALAIVVFAMLPVVLFALPEDELGGIMGLVSLGFGLIAAAGYGIASIVVGFGLLNLRNWARWAAIVLAILGLAGFPIGTVIGVLILIYLLGDEARQVFEGE